LFGWWLSFTLLLYFYNVFVYVVYCAAQLCITGTTHEQESLNSSRHLLLLLFIEEIYTPRSFAIILFSICCFSVVVSAIMFEIFVYCFVQMVFHLYHIFHKVESLPIEIKKTSSIKVCQDFCIRISLDYLFCCCYCIRNLVFLLTSEICIRLCKIVHILYVLTCERSGCKVAWIRTYLG